MQIFYSNVEYIYILPYCKLEITFNSFINGSNKTHELSQLVVIDCTI